MRNYTDTWWTFTPTRRPRCPIRTPATRCVASVSIRRTTRSTIWTAGKRRERRSPGTPLGLAYNVDSLVLVDTSADTEYRYFFSYSLSGGGVQLLVSDVGASGLGLDAHKVYPVRMTATDEGDPTADTPVAPTTASLDVGVWLDITTLSPGDDGICS